MRRKKILWVDDEPALLQVVSRSLEFFGSFDVIVAGTAYEALERMRKEPVDCVGTNIKMEPMDGVALAQDIHKQYPLVPVLFLTALTAGWRAAEQATICDYIRKPFDVEDLVASVAQAVMHGAGWRSNRLREMVWKERGETAQAVIDRVAEHLSEVAEACVSTRAEFLQAAEEGRLFSQRYVLAHTLLPSCVIVQGNDFINSLDKDAGGVLGALWAEAGKGREHSLQVDPGGLSAVVTDYRNGAHVAIITLPGPRYQGEAFLLACVWQAAQEGMDSSTRYFALEFQIRKDLTSGVLTERYLGGRGVIIRDEACPVDIDVFYRQVESIVATTPVPGREPGVSQIC